MLFTYGLPYDPCGPPYLIYCLSVVFPIGCMVLPTDSCGLPYDPCGPPYLIYCVLVVSPIACKVLPINPCGLPYAAHYLLMVFPMIFVVLPI